MKYTREGQSLTIYLKGRIDANNSASVDEELFSIINKEEKPFSLVLNAGDLEYISSAGLRIILKIKKACNDLKIIEVKREVYDIFEMTGFSQMIDIQKEFRKLDVSNCKVIGKGAKGIVYRYDDETIVKVYNNYGLEEINHERYLAKFAFVSGVPSAIAYDTVKVGDKYGSVFELLNASSMTKCLQDNLDKLDIYAKEFADIIKKVHDKEVDVKDLPSAKEVFLKKAKMLLEDLDDKDRLKLQSLLDGIKETKNLIHGDYHPSNIMMQEDEPLLIDMDTLSYGNRIYDLANTYVCLKGFGKIDESMTIEFLGFGHKYSSLFFDYFLKYYLGSEDKDFLKKEDDKVKLLAYIRLYYHFKRRKKSEDDYKNEIEYIFNEIKALINSVSSLNIGE